jgi:hypothetical protein
MQTGTGTVTPAVTRTGTRPVTLGATPGVTFIGGRIKAWRWKDLPLPAWAWATTRADAGGAVAARVELKLLALGPLPPPLVHFAAQALNGKGRTVRPGPGLS